jgi:hypothetical protein
MVSGNLDKNAKLILNLLFLMQKNKNNSNKWSSKVLANLKKNILFFKLLRDPENTKIFNYYSSLNNKNIYTKYIKQNHPLSLLKRRWKIKIKKANDKLSQNFSFFDQFICLTRPFGINLIFLSHCVLAPHKAFGLVSLYGSMNAKPISASFLKKIRNGIWPFIMVIIWQAGSSLSLLKILLLKTFGMRGGRHCKISRGVYFKNPWNIVIRPYCEIGQDVNFDSPSKTIELGHRTRVGQRCVLSSASMRLAETGFGDATNERIKIPAISVIKTNSVIEPLC